MLAPAVRVAEAAGSAGGDTTRLSLLVPEDDAVAVAAAGRYVEVGKQLTTLADDLADDERRAGDKAEQAREQAQVIASNPEVQPEPGKDGGPPEMTPEGEGQNGPARGGTGRPDLAAVGLRRAGRAGA